MATTRFLLSSPLRWLVLVFDSERFFGIKEAQSATMGLISACTSAGEFGPTSLTTNFAEALCFRQVSLSPMYAPPFITFLVASTSLPSSWAKEPSWSPAPVSLLNWWFASSLVNLVMSMQSSRGSEIVRRELQPSQFDIFRCERKIFLMPLFSNSGACLSTRRRREIRLTSGELYIFCGLN